MFTESVPTTALVNPALVRSARALLGWQQVELAARAGVSIETIKRLEGRRDRVSARSATAKAVEVAFTSAGIVFQPDGVKLTEAA